MLTLPLTLPLRASNGGLFVSRGQGLHPTRSIDSWELIFVRSGALGMFEEAQQFTVGAGQTLLLRPGRRHGGTTQYQRDLSFYWIHFFIEESAARPRREKSASPQESLQLPQLAVLRDADRLTALLRRFLDDQESGRLKPLPASLLILQMLCEVAAAGATNEAASAPVSALAGKVEAYIRVNFHRAISTTLIADELQSNPDYLGRIFRRVNGRTIVEFIHDCRMRHAQRLLIESALNINQVARECGFDDSGYFRRLFLRHAGMPPRKFRRLHARVYVNTE